jgi:hypothetical protein
MSRRRRVVVLLVVPASLAAMAMAVSGERTSRARIRWPSREFRDLQAALDAAPNDAVVEIKAGVYRIDQPLVVRGKRLRIVGAGSGRERTPTRSHGPITHLAGPAPRPVVDERGNLVLRAEAVQGLWHCVGAELLFEDIRLSGFDAAIVSTSAGGRTADPVEVRSVVIADTGRGILSLTPADLTVESCTIQDTAWNGISLAPGSEFPGVLPTLIVADSSIINPGGAGIYFEHSLAFFDQVGVQGALAGGIVGVASGSFIHNSVIINNRKAGILLAGGFSEIENNLILQTHATLINNLFGDGVSLWSLDQQMQADLSNNLIGDSERAGFSSFGAWADLTDNLILCASFDVISEDFDGFQSLLTDSGGNLCGCGGQFGACAATGVGPLEPPGPVGGLE